MINSVLKQCFLKGVESIVITDSNQAMHIDKEYQSAVVECVNDVRSATFYALGLSKQKCNPVVLIIDEDYISNTYTGLTEIWFQRIPVIVLAYNSKNIYATKYIDRCVDKTYWIENIEDSGNLDNQLEELVGPILIRIPRFSIPENEINYYEMIRDIKMHSDRCILLYNPAKDSIGENIDVIDPSHKYCLVSKYVGTLRGGQNRILCMPESCLLLDTNIYNMRNFPSNFYLCVKSEDGSNIAKIKDWVENNKIQVLESTENGIEEKNMPKIIIY